MNTEDDHQDDTSSSSHAGMWVGIGVVLLPIIYILSIGPVAFIVEKFSLPSRPFMLFYLPLIWLYEEVEAFENFLDWYADLWGV